MFAFIYSLAYQLDLFKTPFTLNVMTRQQNSSLFGTLFSLAIFLVACLSFFQSNMFLKINPYILEKNVAVQEAPTIRFGNNLPVSLFIFDTAKNVYRDDTIFKFQAYYFREIGATNKTYTPIPLGPCPRLDEKSPYQIYNSSNLSCGLNLDFPLIGTYDDNNFATIFFPWRGR